MVKVIFTDAKVNTDGVLIKHTTFDLIKNKINTYIIYLQLIHLHINTL